jgi:NADH dehydrogenase
MSQRRAILMTGGSGFIGAQIRVELKEAGYAVRNLGRNESLPCRWSLGEQPDARVFQGVGVLIHCAYDMTLSKWDDIRQVNVEGTEKLLAAAAAADVARIILISSIAAFEGCQSMYGRAKLACEGIANHHDAVILRPGMVWGEDSGGVYAAMERWVQSLPMTPVLVPSPSFYMCHVQDLVDLIVELVSQPGWKPEVLTAGYPAPLRFDQVVQELQRRQQIRKPLLRLPWRLPWLACKAFETVGLRPPFRSDGLLGLMKSNPSPNFSALKSHETSFRSFTND